MKTTNILAIKANEIVKLAEEANSKDLSSEENQAYAAKIVAKIQSLQAYECLLASPLKHPKNRPQNLMPSFQICKLALGGT